LLGVYYTQQTGVKAVTWVGPGLLGATVGEDLIRILDLANDENYSLSLTQVTLDKTSRAISIAFDPVQRYLAVGTRTGHIAMWRFVGEYATDLTGTAAATGSSINKEQTANAGSGANTNTATASTSADDWEPQPLVSMISSIYLYVLLCRMYSEYV
jgi:hypothetical protein